MQVFFGTPEYYKILNNFYENTIFRRVFFLFLHLGKNPTICVRAKKLFICFLERLERKCIYPI